MARCCCTIEADLDAAETTLSDMRQQVRDALYDLKIGDVRAATARLNRIAPDPDLEKERKAEAELNDLFGQWRSLPSPRPDFLTFAHKKRKWSAT